MNKCVAALVMASVAWLPPALSQVKPTDSESLAAAGAIAEGEVRKVDKEAKKITLKHGPISNLGMTAMTMVFRVKEPAMLDEVKVGDKVRFRADKIEGAITVTEIRLAKP